MIFISLALNIFGDALRDSLDPKLRIKYKTLHFAIVRKMGTQIYGRRDITVGKKINRRDHRVPREKIKMKPCELGGEIVFEGRNLPARGKSGCEVLFCRLLEILKKRLDRGC